MRNFMSGLGVVLTLVASMMWLAGCSKSSSSSSGGAAPPPNLPGDLQFSQPLFTANESATTATITVSRVGGTNGAVSVLYYTAENGSAIGGGTDFTAASGVLSWADGDAADKTFAVSITDDADVEGSETLTVGIGNPAGGAVLGTPSTATLVIADSDAPVEGVFQFDVSRMIVDESDGTITVTVTRTGGANGTASVIVSDAGSGTATSATDYTAITPTQLNWAAGDFADKTVDIDILDDGTAEAIETIGLSLAAVGAEVLGTTLTMSVVIVDDDVTAGHVQFSAADYVVHETDATLTVTVTRTGGSTGALDVDLSNDGGSATAGADYTAFTSPTTLSWADGDATPKTLVITILDDGIEDFGETINLMLDNVVLDSVPATEPLGTPDYAVVTIVDNEPDAGIIQFTAASFNVNEGDGTIDVTVSRIGGTVGIVSVDVNDDGTGDATDGGTDYDTITSPTNLVWAAGDSADKTLTITITDDGLLESPETINLSLSVPAGGMNGAVIGTPATAVVTILDNDSPSGTVQFELAAYEVYENDVTVTITVTRTGGSSGPATVDYATANGTANGSDFTGVANTLTWADGDATSRQFAVTIKNNDNKVEPDETFSVVLSNATGATLGTPDTTTVTIHDD